MKILSLFVGFFVCLISGGLIRPQQNMPKDVNEAVTYFQNKWTAEEKLAFTKKPEKDAITDLHFSVGLWIRNNWIYGERDKALAEYFLKLGIRAPDDMSSIILTSLYRKLNSKPIDLDEQVNACKKAWKPVLDCEKKARGQAKRTYNKYKIGSSIMILMYVDVQSDGTRNAVTFSCPTTDWKFNTKKDLIIHGKIVQKYTMGSDSNAFFKVKIDKMNFPNTDILMEKVKVGGDTDFSLMNLVIK